MSGLKPYNHSDLPAHMREYFNRFMPEFFTDGFFAPSEFHVDMRETSNEYILDADLPGVKKENIILSYKNGYLTISTKRNENQEIKDEKSYVRRERRFGQLQRSFYVDNIQEDKIEAKFSDGVLTVTLPKDKPQGIQRNIPIH